MIKGRRGDYTRDSVGVDRYEVEVTMRDSGSPRQESTQTLTLNLESNNDNPHRAGTKHIQVYNYKVHCAATIKVHVYDYVYLFEGTFTRNISVTVSVSGTFYLTNVMGKQLHRTALKPFWYEKR